MHLMRMIYSIFNLFLNSLVIFPAVCLRSYFE